MLMTIACVCGQVLLCCRNVLRDVPAEKGAKRKKDLFSFFKSGARKSKRKVKPSADSKAEPPKDYRGGKVSPAAWSAGATAPTQTATTP